MRILDDGALLIGVNINLAVTIVQYYVFAYRLHSGNAEEEDWTVIQRQFTAQ